ncbi:hypothetical protein MKW92_048379 [Papaver armeniacum]|nr:hypothetical protein MKW92_048379 [Papaver armeniacum]
MSIFGNSNNANPNKSYEVVQPPTDSISSLCFSPKANHLVATSWDNQVRCWEIQRSGTSISSVAKASISHEQPVLCSAWKDDGTAVFSGGCDKQVKMWPLLSGGQAETVAVHDAPVKEVAWLPEMNLLVTGSWDKTLKYWDIRQKTAPVHTQQLPERCYALSVKYPLMVVGTADRNLIYQTKCVSVFPDQQVGVHHLDEALKKELPSNATEWGRRYSVNSINFHPVHRTLATAGSDGVFSFWDKDSAFNDDGSIYAYAVCYDWSKGAENHKPATARASIFLHLPPDSDVKPKSKPATGKK